MRGDEARPMTARPSPSGQRAPTAAAAFLRGVHRRAIALAWLQAGDLRRAGPPVAVAGRDFPRLAASASMDSWPVLYWRLLVCAPDLRTTAADASWPRDLAWLGELPGAVRAVLLLRLVAQLEAAAIAAVLEVPVAAVHAGLNAALPVLPDGSHDPRAWQSRQAALREALDALPASAAPPAPGETGSGVPGAWPGRRLALWAGVGACALGLAATFLPFQSPGPGGGRDEPSAGVPLAPSQAPVVAMDPELALLAHPDLEQLADAADAPVVRDLGFYVWYAARLAEQAPSGATGSRDAR